MKKVLFVTVCAGLLAACSSPAPKRVGINAKPEKLTAAIAKADRSCKTDEDCQAVQKGCCLCAGFESVNVEAAGKVQKVWNRECPVPAPCTREMCYVQITPKCVNRACTGELILPKGRN